MKIRPTTRSSRSAPRGTVAAIVAVLMPVVLGTTALALDGGVLYLQRRQVQNAADAAALAAAYNYSTTSSLTSAKGAAQAVAARNGFTIATSAVTQPSSNQFAVAVTANPPRFFSKLWGKGSLTVAASGTAQVSSGSSSTPYSTSAVILLDKTASGSLTLAGSASITASAGIQVNSTSSTAVNANNAGHTGSNLNIVGGYTTSSGGYLNGTITTGAASVGDPLAKLAAPSSSSLTTSPTNGLAGYPGYGSYTLSPGLYTSSVSLGNGGTFTMSPGLYYFSGSAGFTVANGATLTGSGVTIYSDGGAATPLSFQGGTTTTLSAASYGSATNNAIPGVVYFQNRTSTGSPNIANGTSNRRTGTFYAASAPITLAGGSCSNLASQIVVDSMNLSNNAQITVPYSSSTVASKSAGYSYPVALVQ